MAPDESYFLFDLLPLACDRSDAIEVRSAFGVFGFRKSFPANESTFLSCHEFGCVPNRFHYPPLV